MLSRKGLSNSSVNEDNISYTKKVLDHWNSFDMKIIFEGLFIGIIAGVIVVAYRLLLEIAEGKRENFISLIQSNGYYLNYILYFIVLIVVGLLLGFMVKKAPNIKGSGIPQVKGFILRQVKLDWLKEIILKFIGGILALGFGLSAGREGPSVQLGATTGLGVSRLFRRFHIEEKYLVTAGASAGLAAAFNAPLAGVMFAVEELHKNISPIMLSCVIGASIMADFISGTVFGLDPVLSFQGMEPLPLSLYGLVVLLGVLVALLGKLFNYMIIKCPDIYKKTNLPDKYWPIVPMLLAGVFALIYPKVLGGGHHLIIEFKEQNVIWYGLILLFVIKLLFTVITYGSKVPGGIFLPLLVLGSIIGYLMGKVGISLNLMGDQYLINFIALGMAGYFTAVVKAPITGSILISEMTGSFTHLLPLIAISLVAHIVTDLIDSKPIYDLLMEKMLIEDRGDISESNFLKEVEPKKSILEIPVVFGSKIEHQRISDINWPDRCLIVGIRRGEKEIIPKGDYKVYAGDFLIVLTDYKDDPWLIRRLNEMANEPCKIKHSIVSHPN